MKAFITSTCLSFMLLLAMTSCTNASLEESMIPVEKDSFQSLLIERGTTPITAEQAINVAKIFDLQNGQSETKAMSSQYADVYTQKNAQGDPIFYAVNRADNKGYIIVGTSRNYFPILAYVEKGHFDEGYVNKNLYAWAEIQRANIEKAENGGLTDCDVDFHSLWSQYEKNGIDSFIATKTEAEAFALRQASIAAWENQGYTCYELQECPSNLPSSTYNYWCSLASTYAHPDYNYMTYSIILEKRVTQYTTTGPIIGSSWDQANHFNDSIPNHCLVGCVPVAIGQIMWYYEKPTSFSWNSMPASTASSATASFLYTLGDWMGIDYTNNDPSASHGDGQDALEHYGYLTEMDYYDEAIVASNISQGKPVYLGGGVYGSNWDHAWVCEGLRPVYYHYEYELKILNDIEPLEYTNITPPISTADGYYRLLYHNLGFGGDGDGWYMGSTLYSSEGVFTSLLMIYDITPPTN